MIINFINYDFGSDFVLTDLWKRVDDWQARFLFRQSGFKRNARLIKELKEFEELEGKEYTVYTDDETMLAYAEYDESIHSFKVFIRDEHTANYFIPISARHPNLRNINNLMVMQHKNMFDFKENLRRNNNE